MHQSRIVNIRLSCRLMNGGNESREAPWAGKAPICLLPDRGRSFTIDAKYSEAISVRRGQLGCNNFNNSLCKDVQWSWMGT